MPRTDELLGQPHRGTTCPLHIASASHFPSARHVERRPERFLDERLPVTSLGPQTVVEADELHATPDEITDERLRARCGFCERGSACHHFVLCVEAEARVPFAISQILVREIHTETARMPEFRGPQYLQLPGEHSMERGPQAPMKRCDRSGRRARRSDPASCEPLPGPRVEEVTFRTLLNEQYVVVEIHVALGQIPNSPQVRLDLIRTEHGQEVVVREDLPMVHDAEIRHIGLEPGRRSAIDDQKHPPKERGKSLDTPEAVPELSIVSKAGTQA